MWGKKLSTVSILATISLGLSWVSPPVAAQGIIPHHIDTSLYGETMKPLEVAGKGRSSGFGKKPSATFQKPAKPKMRTGITGPNRPRIPRPWPPVPTPTKPIKPTKPQKGDPPPDRPLKPKGPKWIPPGI